MLPSAACAHLNRITLTLIAKPNGGVRPIGGGGPFGKVVAAAVRTRDAGKCAKVLGGGRALQVAVEMKRGMAIGISKMQAAHDRESVAVGGVHGVFVSTDISNAYNTRFRIAIIKALETFEGGAFAWLIPVALSLLGQSSKACAWGSSGMRHIIDVAEGVIQGDTLSTILFCISIQAQIEAAQATFDALGNGGQVLAIADDVFLAGPAQEAVDVAKDLLAALEAGGSIANVSKTTVHVVRAPEVEDAEQIATIIGFDPRGFRIQQGHTKVGGIVIGDDKYTSEYLFGKLSASANDISKFTELDLPKQVQWVILARCIAPRLDFQASLVSPRLMGPVAAAFTDILTSAAEDILGQAPGTFELGAAPDTSDAVALALQTRLALSTSDKGLGLRLLSHTYASTFLASFIFNFGALLGAPPVRKVAKDTPEVALKPICSATRHDVDRWLQIHGEEFDPTAPFAFLTRNCTNGGPPLSPLFRDVMDAGIAMQDLVQRYMLPGADSLPEMPAALRFGPQIWLTARPEQDLALSLSHAFSSVRLDLLMSVVERELSPESQTYRSLLYSTSDSMTAALVSPTAAYVLTSDQFVVIMCHAVGAPQPLLRSCVGTELRLPDKHVVVDAYGDVLFSAALSGLRGSLIKTHDAVVRELHRFFKSLKLSTHMEDTALLAQFAVAADVHLARQHWCQIDLVVQKPISDGSAITRTQVIEVKRLHIGGAYTGKPRRDGMVPVDLRASKVMPSRLKDAAALDGIAGHAADGSGPCATTLREFPFEAVVVGHHFELSESVRNILSKSIMCSQEAAFAWVTKARNTAAAHSAALCAAMRRFNISTQRAWADAFIDRARAYALKVAPPAVADPEPQWVAQPADEFHVMQDSLAFVDMQDVWM